MEKPVVEVPTDEDEEAHDTIRIRVTIPGEGHYDLAMAVHYGVLANQVPDFVDYYIETMAKKIRQFRSVRVHGECSEKDCERPRTAAPDRKDPTKCQPHDYELHQRALLDRFNP